MKERHIHVSQDGRIEGPCTAANVHQSRLKGKGRLDGESEEGTAEGGKGGKEGGEECEKAAAQLEAEAAAQLEPDKCRI